jgi:hypothetical protein
MHRFIFVTLALALGIQFLVFTPHYTYYRAIFLLWFIFQRASTVFFFSKAVKDQVRFITFRNAILKGLTTKNII